ncbi:MAG: flagellar hook-associated protein FlgK [Jannaschia sp.]
MSLSASLSNALSGLTISSRRAEIIASNVANADTPGYAQRRLATTGPIPGLYSSVHVSRAADAGLTYLRRDAAANSADAGVAQAFYTQVDLAIGDPDQAGSLQDLLSRLDAAFTSAASDPTSPAKLVLTARAASDLASKFNDIADIVTSERRTSEGRIADSVERLNRDLASVSRLNADIVRLKSTGNDPSDLLDQRQLIVDRIAVDIPIRELQRDNGTIALVSQGGVILLDGRAAEIGFSERTYVEPDMSYPDQLSGLTVNGRNVGSGKSGDGLAGGGLGALFRLRDDMAPRTMEQLDALAFELATRFQSPDVDPSLAAADAGLFTDGGNPASALALTGLAGRLAINASLDPGDSATTWRLRDGLGAVSPGPASSSAQLLRFSDVFRDSAAPAASGLGDGVDDLVGFAARTRSAFSLERVAADDAARFATNRSETLEALRDGGKVDVDEEMRRLIDVEQAYAANARLIQAVGQMMDRLTEI